MNRNGSMNPAKVPTTPSAAFFQTPRRSFLMATDSEQTRQRADGNPDAHENEQSKDDDWPENGDHALIIAQKKRARGDSS
jgi:hypothetical protein